MVMVNFICNAGKCTVLNLIKKFSAMDNAASGAMCIHIAHSSIIHIPSIIMSDTIRFSLALAAQENEEDQVRPG